MVFFLNATTLKIMILAVLCASLSACRRAVPQPDFNAPVIYRFAERTAYAQGRVVSPKQPSSDASARQPYPCMSSSNAVWGQAANSVVRWRMVVPRRGYLRFHATSRDKNAHCQIRLVNNKKASELFDGTPPAESTELSLAEFGGRRTEIEFSSTGNTPVEWQVCEVGGHVDPADVNVYLITIDSLRADYTGFLGHRVGVTPFLDQS